jgi:hypothetical protein
MTRATCVGILSMVLATQGCGYALVGRGVNVDPSIKRLGVPLFKDRTGRAGLDQKVTQKVIEELLKRGRFDVTQDRTGVDALVEGDLLTYTETPAGFTPGSSADARTRASRYVIMLTADVAYIKTGEKDPIWSNEHFAVTDVYDVTESSDGLTDSEQAVDRMTTTFARRLVGEMLEGF